MLDETQLEFSHQPKEIGLPPIWIVRQFTHSYGMGKAPTFSWARKALKRGDALKYREERGSLTASLLLLRSLCHGKYQNKVSIQIFGFGHRIGLPVLRHPFDRPNVQQADRLTTAAEYVPASEAASASSDLISCPHTWIQKESFGSTTPWSTEKRNLTSSTGHRKTPVYTTTWKKSSNRSPSRDHIA